LLTCGQIDDGQPAMAQAEAGLDVKTTFVRAPMDLRLIHPP
jgi:hypothetical protein